jgi:hypothetical protein
MALEISGTLTQVLEAQTGQGKNGVWKKQSFIVEMPGQYPKSVCVTAWGDKIDLNDFPPGTPVTVGIDVESREYQGKWYTDVKAWKMNKAGAADSQASSSSDNYPPPPPAFVADSPAMDDDLPF